METAVHDGRSEKLSLREYTLMVHKQLRRPFTEKLLFRFPLMSRMLSRIGAHAEQVFSKSEPGGLAKMMMISRSIDFIGRDKKEYRFHVRPMT